MMESYSSHQLHVDSALEQTSWSEAVALSWQFCSFFLYKHSSSSHVDTVTEPYCYSPWQHNPEPKYLLHGKVSPPCHFWFFCQSSLFPDLSTNGISFFLAIVPSYFAIALMIQTPLLYREYCVYCISRTLPISVIKVPHHWNQEVPSGHPHLVGDSGLQSQCCGFNPDLWCNIQCLHVLPPDCRLLALVRR